MEGSAGGGRPFSRPRWPLVDIGRSLARAQRPAQRRTARRRTANFSAPGQLFSPRIAARDRGGAGTSEDASIRSQRPRLDYRDGIRAFASGTLAKVQVPTVWEFLE